MENYMTPEAACSITFDNTKYVGFVYMLTFTQSGKHYVGQTTKQWKRRWKNHKSKTSGCCALKNALAKYPVDTIEFDILGFAKSLQDLTNLEEKYILEYNCLTPNGYNISLPTQAVKHPEIRRDRIRVGLALNRVRKKNPDATVEDALQYIKERDRKAAEVTHKGTPEFRNKMKEVYKRVHPDGLHPTRLKTTDRVTIDGNKHVYKAPEKKIKARVTGTSRRAVIVYETGVEYGSIIEAATACNIVKSRQNIAGCCTGQYKQVKGLHFYYADTTPEQLAILKSFWFA